MNPSEALSSYEVFLDSLLRGDRKSCRGIVEEKIEKGIGLKAIYLQLFQKSLYEVGERWELGDLSVETEHIATSIISYLMNLSSNELFVPRELKGRAVVACSKGDSHFLGARMVADILESSGFETQFLGPHHESDTLYSLVDEVGADIVGLSMSMPSNWGHLEQTANHLLENFNADVYLGGLGMSEFKEHWKVGWDDRVRVVQDLEELEQVLPTLV